MIILTILNTLAISYLFYKEGKFYIEFRKDKTFVKETVVAYRITLWKRTSQYSASGIYTLVIPLKNKVNTERDEEINRMFDYSYQNKLQSLTAKFSWLKTWEEVKVFQKYYTCVEPKIVENLVAKFIPKVS